MSLYDIINMAGWTACIIFAILIAVDFIKVEKGEISRNKRSGPNT